MRKIYLFLIFLLLSIQVSAQTYTYTANGVEWEFTISGSNATITGTTQDHSFTGAFNIPATVSVDANNYTVTTIRENAFRWYRYATSLTLPNTITLIENSAFQGCRGLTGKLEIPEGVTTIGEYAFDDCYGFTGELKIPTTVTTIKDYAFYNCWGFNGKLTIPEGVTTIGNSVFYNCSSLTGELKIPSTVTTIRSMAFQRCYGFTGELKIPEGVTTIEKSAFINCNKLTSLTIPSTVTTIGISAFQNCNGLTGELKIPEGVTTIEENAFSWCRGLTGELKIPAGVTTIGKGAFSYCPGLESVIFESGSAYTYTGSISVWQGCPSLKYIDMTGVGSPITTTIARSAYNDLFSGIRPYTMVYLPAGSSAATAGEENFVIGNTCDKFTVYDSHSNYKSGNVGCNYPILHPFTATQASYANRTFSGTTCKTLCLPYPATLPAGMQAYELKEKIPGSQTYRFVSISGTTLAANTPYIVRITDNASHSFGTDNGVFVPATPASIETPATHDGNSFFGGTTVNIDNATAAGMGIYNLSNNQWLPITTGDTNGYLHSFRAYVRTTGGAPAKSFALVLDDDTTTGIDEIELDVEQGKGEIYTLDGRSMGTDINALKSGEIYIRNGKKFYKF